MLSGLFSPSAQAQTVISNGTATLASVDNVTADEVSVAYTVTDNSGLYTYDYIVQAPNSASVSSFNVGFDGESYTVVPGSVNGGTFGQEVTGIGVDWLVSIPAGGHSGTLSFESYEAPTVGNGNANGNPSPPAPWASTYPGGEHLPVPIPEPGTTSLLAMALLALPLRFRGHKIELNRKRN